MISAAVAGAGAPEEGGGEGATVAGEPGVHVVTPGDLRLTFRGEGRIDSARRMKVRVGVEEYRGALEIAEVLRRSGSVERDEPLLRFDTSEIEEQLVEARESLDDARRRLDLAREDRRIATESAAMRLERAERAKVKADHELEIWEQYNSERMLKASALSVQSRENNLDDQKEELAQLEAMYAGTRLDSATKEIVLQRARRNVRMSEQWLAIARNDDLITRQYRHGDEDRKVHEGARHNALELEHARAHSAMTKVRKEMEVEAAQRRLREAEEHVARLEADAQHMVLTAPAAGLMTPIDLQAGDTVSVRQVVTEILDPAALVAKMPLEAGDLRVVSEGVAVELSLPAYPEVELAGAVTEIAAIGAKSGNSTHFDAVMSIDGDHRLLRVGLRCIAEAEATLPKVLLVPKDAVRTEEGETRCHVWMESEAQERVIRIGACNDEMCQVVSGLDAGEHVLLEEPAAGAEAAGEAGAEASPATHD